jgi:hypothetical protein
MTVNIAPLRSQAGFQSPGFFVSPTGNLTIEGEFVSSQLIVNGITILETEDSTPSLGSDIKNSSLTNLGVLAILEVQGDISIKDNLDNTNISIIDGVISIVSTTKGTLDNIAIGQTTPVEANITVLTADNGTITTLSSTTILTQEIEAQEIESDDIVINNQPVELFHATRKDYVDNKISALSIALGA